MSAAKGFLTSELSPIVKLIGGSTEERHHMQHQLSLALFGTITLPWAAHAQLTTPAHWKWITDEPAQLVTDAPVADSAWRFVSMPPGWHVTTGPGAVLYDPAYAAAGRFTLEAKIFLFPNGSDEGYGLFLGGHDLENDGRSMLTFFIRRDGAASVVRVRGDESEFVVPWERHPGIRPQEGGNTIENVLRVSAEPDQLVYVVNDDTVAVIPRSDAAVGGRFGFRVGAKLNLHISNLDFTQHLALPPSRQ